MENVELVYSLFNQFVYQEAKNNIDLIDYYFQTTPGTVGNRLIESLLDSIRKYPLESLDVPLFQGIMIKTGKNPAEQQKIMGDIIKWKSFSREQIEPARQFLRDICASSLIQRANGLYPQSPSEFLKYLKQVDLKTDTSDIMSISDFDKIDVNSMVANGLGVGYSSSHQWINESFQPLNKYEEGQMIMISMPPGCMSGDTEVYLADGRVVTLEELHRKNERDIHVWTCMENSEITSSYADDCQISKYVSEWTVVDVNGKSLKVTENHPFMTTKGWKRADELKIGDEMIGYSPTNIEFPELLVTNVTTEKLDSPQPVYDLVDVKIYHNYSVKLYDGVAIFSHNTGKTLFMMGEALTMATNGARCHYLAMGDMKPRDFVVRLGSIFSGLQFSDTVSDLSSIYNSLRGAVGDRLGITVVPSAKITSEQYISYIKERDYDVLFIDYDSNFLSNASDNMYSEYGKIYDQLTELTQRGKLVFIAAQPKPASWNQEVIQLDMVGESSRKIHTVDVLVTAGRAPSPNHLGIFKICKNRRGEEGVEMPYIRLGNGRFKFIPRGLYSTLSGYTEKRFFSEGEIDGMVRQYNDQLNAVNNRASSSFVNSIRDSNPFN